MRSLVIEAKSAESALAMHAALAEFHAELLGDDLDGYHVAVDVGESDSQVVALLDRLQEHINARNDCSGAIELDGRRYTVHPE
jgi:hypothetical protein